MIRTPRNVRNDMEYGIGDADAVSLSILRTVIYGYPYEYFGWAQECILHAKSAPGGNVRTEA
jgi:hypothetical protein